MEIISTAGLFIGALVFGVISFIVGLVLNAVMSKETGSILYDTNMLLYDARDCRLCGKNGDMHVFIMIPPTQLTDIEFNRLVRLRNDSASSAIGICEECYENDYSFEKIRKKP